MKEPQRRWSGAVPGALGLLAPVLLTALSLGADKKNKAAVDAGPAPTVAEALSAVRWPPAKRQTPAAVAAAIDREVEARLKKDKVPASPPADDAEFLRRVHLDIVGRTPAPDKAAAFLDGKAADKRAKLIDELLESKDYGKHFGNVWHDLIVPRTPISARIDPEALRGAFADCFNANLPWGEVAARVALCREGAKEKNFLAFHRVNGDMGGNPMANVVARSYTRLFLGVRMECAECHDDPYKPWKQEQYWGVAAFFGRVTVAKDKEPTAVVEGTGYKTPKGNNFRLVAGKDGTLAVHLEAWKNVGKSMKPRVLGGGPLDFRPGQLMVPAFAQWVAGPDNPYLARAAVNRLWAHFFARGLLNPVDDFYEGAEPSHPELLRLLAEDFTRSRHDVKHLIRCVCNSKAYGRTSRPVAGNDELDDPLFSRMPLKVLTAEVLLDSLGVAYGNAELFPRAAPRAKDRRGGGSPALTRRDFLQLFSTDDVEGDPTDYNHGVAQVLHLLNVPLYNAGGATVDRLLKEKLTAERAVERLYLATLSRRPTAAELKRKLDLVARHKSAREGLNGVLWTLVNQSEFLVNH